MWTNETIRQIRYKQNPKKQDGQKDMEQPFPQGKHPWHKHPNILNISNLFKHTTIHADHGKTQYGKPQNINAINLNSMDFHDVFLEIVRVERLQTKP